MAKMTTTHEILYTIAIFTFAYFFIPPAWLFLQGIEPGMDYIDRIYPYPQPRKPFHDHPLLIYIHMYANITALGIQLALLRLHPPKVSRTTHRRLAWTYTVLVTAGTLDSLLYAAHQNYGSDGGKSGTLAFTIMACATFYTLAAAHFYVHVRLDAALHREWALRHCAVLFGNGVVFRVLANTFLVGAQRWGADFYAAWCQMIYLAWVVPLALVEQCLAWERSRPRERAVKIGKWSKEFARS